MLRRATALVLPALLLAACGTTMHGPAYPPPPVPLPPPPPPGAVEGHGAFHTASGARVTCAGFSVALMPDAARYRRRVLELYNTTDRAMEPVADVKARSAKLPPSPDTAPIASASCDAHGEFAFANVVPEAYFLIAHVKVRPAAAGRDDFVVLRWINVPPGASADVSLAP